MFLVELLGIAMILESLQSAGRWPDANDGLKIEAIDKYLEQNNYSTSKR